MQQYYPGAGIPALPLPGVVGQRPASMPLLGGAVPAAVGARPASAPAGGNLVSSGDLKQWQSQIGAQISPEEVKRQVAARERQEKALIANQAVCPNLREKPIGSVENLPELISQQFYNPELMAEAFCTLDSNFVSAVFEGGNRAVRRVTGDLKRIGAESAYGMAMNSHLKPVGASIPLGAKGMILKTSQNPEGNAAILHELVVGMYGTNKLRAKVPNFAYVLGGFVASPPLMSGKDVITYAEGTPTVTYVAYESITPSQSVREWLPTARPLDFINTFYQVLLALDVGVKESDFTHYDLHDQNVLIRGTAHQNGFFIQYPHPKLGKIYLLTNFIATIIDYGTSHIRYQGQSYGDFSLRAYGVVPDRSFPIHDIYKFLMFSALAASRGNNAPVMAVCEKIYRFFNKTENFPDALKIQVASFYFPPAMAHLVSIPVSEFIAYFEEVFATELNSIRTQTPTGYPILNCESEGMCSSLPEIESLLGRAFGQESENLTMWTVAEKKLQIDADKYRALDLKHRQEIDNLSLRAREASQQIYALNKGNWLALESAAGTQSSRDAYDQQLANTVKLIDSYQLVAERLRVGAQAAQINGGEVNYYSNTFQNFQSNYLKLVNALISNLRKDLKLFNAQRQRSFAIKELAPLASRLVIVEDFINRVKL